MVKKILALLMAAILFLTSVMTDNFEVYASQPEEQETSATEPEIMGAVTNNRDKQSYSMWAATVKSYLIKNADGTMTRVEYTEKYVAVEQYSAGGKLLGCKNIELELPMFGGFYAGTNYNFLVFGQPNIDEKDDVEVIRVVKYTKDWSRVGSAGLYGANTIIPFEAGSLRMAESGDMLYVRTCHEMYKSSDGLNHQANLMFSVKIPTLEITDERSGISTISSGYVSHSFNQFVLVNGSELAVVDHGDAYPRCVVLMKYGTPAGQETLGYCTPVSAFDIEGKLGNNSTGVSVGGFEYSDTSYLIAGNSVPQDENYNSFGARNIFVSSTPIDTFTNPTDPTVHWITDYKNSNVSTPQLVKIDNSRFLLLWTVDGVLNYVFLDEEGQPCSEIYSSEEGTLSDCKPILIGKKVVWYCTYKDVPLFYAIDVDSPDTVDILNRIHTVRYDLMGGTMEDSTGKTVAYGTPYGTLPEPVKEGSVFIGWYTSAEEGSHVTEETTVTAAGDEKLYARWLEKKPCGDNLTWDVDNGILTISGTGKMYDMKYHEQPWYGCQDFIQKVVIEDGVTNIGKNSFSEFINVTDITVADSVSGIGSFAFSYCKSLNNLKLPKSAEYIDEYAFFNCISLKNIKIPDGVSDISYQIFGGCYNLTDVSLPKSVKYISIYAFNNCSSLRSIEIPEGAVSIEQYAFNGCTALEWITIPNTVYSIGDKAFWGHSESLVIYGYKNTIAESYAITNNITFVSIDSTDDNICGENLKWDLTDGILTIKGTGNMTDWLSVANTPWYSRREQIDRVIIENGVTGIGKFAFSGSVNIKKVSIADSVTNIGEKAFYGCTGLNDITLPNGITDIRDYTFYGCAGLISITVPDGVTGIGAYAFSDCSGLKEIVLPKNLVYISNYAFSGCSGLEEIVLPRNLAYIGNHAFSDCSGLKEIVIPNNVSCIEAYTFSGCSSLTGITILGKNTLLAATWLSDNNDSLVIYSYEGSNAETYAKSFGITFIRISESFTGVCGEYLTWKLETDSGILTISGSGEMTCWRGRSTVPWYSKSGLIKEVVIEDGVTNVGAYAFSGCSDITTVTIADSVKEIGPYAFDVCGGLTAIKIPFGVKKIGEYAFYGCKSLSSILLPDGITSIEPYTFSECMSLSSIELPNGVTGIGKHAFMNCNSLSEVKLPNGVAKIEEYAFFSCINLSSIELPDSMTYIGSCAFYECKNLSSIQIPEKMDAIAEYTFCNCSNLEEIIIPGTVTSIDETSLIGCKNNLVIYGYKGTAAEEYAKNKYRTFIDISSGYSGDCGERLTWNLTDGILTISGTGKMEDWTYYRVPWYGKRDSICEVVIEEGVTGIGKSAFNDCTNLEKITVPITITSINDTAFSGCREDMAILGYKNTFAEEYAKEKDILFVALSYEFNGICGENMVWNLKDGILTISGEGEMAEMSISSQIPWQSYRLLINEAVVGNGVESISRNAFSGCRNLKKVTLPDSITAIGGNAFSGCSSLSNLTLPNAITEIADNVFLNCSSLTVIDIPNGVKKIGSEAFSGCSSLTTIDIPDGVTSISSRAFFGCSSLTVIDIPDSVTSMSQNIFFNCSSLSDVTLPNSIKEIANGMFRGCVSLRNITIPESVVKIGNSVFKDCSSLKSIVIPGQVEKIENDTFSGCISLESVTIPIMVVSIDDTAFSGCSDNMVIHCYKNTVTEEYVRKNEITADVRSYECSGRLTEHIMWNLKDGILTISTDGAEEKWSYEESWKPYRNSIVQVVMEEGIINIGNSAFNNFSRLSSVKIPVSVTTIGYDAFYGCSSLTEIEIPEDVTEIGSKAFYDCTGLKEIKFYGDKPRYLNRMAFGNVTANGYYPVNNQSWDGISEDLCGGKFTWIPFYIAEGTCGEGLSWTLDGEGTLTINGIGKMGVFESAEAVPWYAYKDKIRSVVIEDEVESIGAYSFYGLNGLENVTIPAHVSSIGEYAFGGCSGLTEIIFGGSMPDFGNGVFDGVTADVYYPANDSSWENSDKNPAGGNLTWRDHVHVVQEDAGKAATCTETGITAGSHCTVCGKVFKEQQVIAALGHIETESSEKEPTCTESGTTGGIYCERCHIWLKEIQKVEALGHCWDKEIIIAEATCTESGLKRYMCSVCGQRGELVHIEALGHSLDEGTVTKKPTCIVAGTILYECTVCGTNMTKELATSSHTLDYYPAVAATCMDFGLAEHWNCCVCGKNFSDEKAITELVSLIVQSSDHTYANGICTVCGKKDPTAETNPDDPVEECVHKWSAWKQSSKATVFAPEKQKRTCSICKTTETRIYGKALKPYIKLTANSLKMQIKQSTAKFKVTEMAAGDYVVSIKSGNTKILNVSSVKRTGTFKLKAQNKAGTAKLTITLASGLKKTIKVNVGKAKVNTTKITVASKKVSLKKGGKMTLKPIVSPVTSQQKVTYKSSDKKVASVNTKGIITAKKKGTAKITVASGKKKVIVTVKVTK